MEGTYSCAKRYELRSQLYCSKNWTCGTLIQRGCCWGGDPPENRLGKAEGGNLGGDPQPSTWQPSGCRDEWWGLQGDPSHEFPISEGPFLVFGIQREKKKKKKRVYGILILHLSALWCLSLLLDLGLSFWIEGKEREKLLARIYFCKEEVR